jgi:hypothetical protein
MPQAVGLLTPRLDVRAPPFRNMMSGSVTPDNPQPQPCTRQRILVFVRSRRSRLQHDHVSFSQPRRRGRQITLPPPIFEKTAYFRLVIAVRSAESLAMPAAPHQFEPTPVGLIGVRLVDPEPLNALVKALQSPFDKLVSE